jgi:hypothetical protein
VAIRAATLLAIAALSTASAAQGPAVDVKMVLYRAANAHGMLRGVQEVDAITSNQFEATGRMTIPAQGNGPAQEFTLTRFKAWMNYSYPGMRVDLERVSGTNAPERVIGVVSGGHAWNEAGMPGGQATAVPALLNQRLLGVWMLPHSVIKAARRAADKVTVSEQGGATVLTIPLPAPLAGTMVATLSDRSLVEKVVARLPAAPPARGETVVEATYTDYRDPDMSDVPFPHRIVQKMGTVTTLDLTVSAARMYNPYVIMPVPENVEKAPRPTAATVAR